MSNRSGSPYSTPRDANHVPLLVAASTVDGITPVVLEADPTTHLLQVSSSGGGGGGTQYTQGGATVTNPTGNSLIYFNNSNQPIAVTSSNPLPITGTISVGSTADESAFTAGTSTTGPVAGVFNDSVASLSSGQQGTIRSTATRALHINLRNNTGTEIGTSTTPMQVSLANTATNSTAVKVDGSGVTQPVSLTSTTITGSVAVTGTFFQTTQPVSLATNTPTLQAGSTTAVTQATGTNLHTVTDTGSTTAVTALPAIPAGTNAVGTFNLSPIAQGGWTPYFANAITTTVAPTVAAGKFGGYMLINLNSAPAYLQVFDTTGAVTLGSTAPTFVIPIPANATAANGLAANVELANGIVIANGIKCAATTTSNGATTVTTGLTGTLWIK